jgi:hypothetical protein
MSSLLVFILDYLHGYVQNYHSHYKDQAKGNVDGGKCERGLAAFE